MTGVVLCGGASTRMGHDKGTRNLDSGTWAQHGARLFEELDLPYTISVSEKQLPVYEALFPVEKIICDLELAVYGPLKGIVSVHQQMPDEDLLVLACDMPGMQTVILEQLLRLYEQQPDYDCYLFATNSFMQPLCAIYRAQRLQTLLKEIEAGLLEKHSMMHFVEASTALIVEADQNMLGFFDNFNTLDDLNRFGK